MRVKAPEMMTRVTVLEKAINQRDCNRHRGGDPPMDGDHPAYVDHTRNGK